MPRLMPGSVIGGRDEAAVKAPRLLALMAIALLGCHSRPPQGPRPAWLPDPRLTPGATILGVTVADICTPGYSGRVRNVPEAVKRQACAAYGVSYPAHGYEIDHLISLELGGSNELGNLWPQPGTGQWTWHEKDQLENTLHRAVCSGQLTLAEAQRMIAGDWTRAYARYVGVRTRAIEKPAAEMGTEMP